MKTEELRKALDDRIRSLMPVQTKPAKVVSVDERGATCKVFLVDDSDLIIDDVRLRATISNSNTGAVIIPKVGSYVLIGLIGNSNTEAFVVMFSEINKVIVENESSITLEISDIIKLNGEASGLIKIDEFRTEIEKNNEMLKAIKNVLTTWTPASGDGGAALKSAASAALSALNTGSFGANIENKKVKHGW